MWTSTKLLDFVTGSVTCISIYKTMQASPHVLHCTILYLKMTKIGQFFDASIFYVWGTGGAIWSRVLFEWVKQLQCWWCLHDLTPSLDGSGIDWLYLALKIAFLIFRQFVRQFSGNLCVVVILIKLVPCSGKPDKQYINYKLHFLLSITHNMCIKVTQEGDIIWRERERECVNYLSVQFAYS